MPQDIQFLLGEMNAKLDTLVKRGEEDRSAVAALTVRVTELESLRWKLVGAATVLGGLAGLLAHFA